jgi:dihydropyrimidinase
VGTDHCAWTKEEKEGGTGLQFQNIWDAIPGMTGMEYMLPVLMTFGVRAGRIGIEQVARLCSENPARTFGLYPRKGAIQVGSDADLVIVDPDKRATVTPEYHRGARSDWSIYDGWSFHGMPETTIVRGTVVVERGEFVAQRGHGTYVGAAARAAVPA